MPLWLLPFSPASLLKSSPSNFFHVSQLSLKLIVSSSLIVIVAYMCKYPWICKHNLLKLFAVSVYVYMVSGIIRLYWKTN